VVSLFYFFPTKIIYLFFNSSMLYVYIHTYIYIYPDHAIVLFIRLIIIVLEGKLWSFSLSNFLTFRLLSFSHIPVFSSAHSSHAPSINIVFLKMKNRMSQSHKKQLKLRLKFLKVTVPLGVTLCGLAEVFRHLGGSWWCRFLSSDGTILPNQTVSNSTWQQFSIKNYFMCITLFAKLSVLNLI
jgi:hypothetical protein